MAQTAPPAPPAAVATGPNMPLVQAQPDVLTVPDIPQPKYALPGIRMHSRAAACMAMRYVVHRTHARARWSTLSCRKGLDSQQLHLPAGEVMPEGGGAG